MVDLDDLNLIKKFDTKNMVGSILFLKDQVKSAWQASKNLEIPSSYKSVKNICLAGMGGSALGPHIIRSVYDTGVPFQIAHEYSLPSFVNEESLVIVSSYSGNTEETIAALGDAVKKKAKIIGIASGGVLIEELRRNSLPYYQIDTKYNPSQNPRMGLGFSIAGILGMLAKLGFVEGSDERIDRIIKTINESNNIFGTDSKTIDNEAKNTALELMEKIVIILAGPFLAGNAHTFTNQINESAKALGTYFLLPEMNHHLLEGTSYPVSLRNSVKFFTFDSDLYEEKIKIRMELSKELLSKKNIRSFSYKIKAREKDLAAFEALTFSLWVSFYMAIAYEENPGLIPNVDYFKEQLAKRSG